MEGQTKAVAWLRTWISSGRGTISSIHTREAPAACAASLWPRVSSNLQSRDGTEEMVDALLAGDPSDEDDERPAGVDAVPDQGGVIVVGDVGPRVDAVVDGVDAAGVHRRIAGEQIPAHRLRDGDHRVGGEQGGALAEEGEGVATTELLGLPGSEGLQAVGGAHVGDVPDQLCQGSGTIRVPGGRGD